VIKKGNVMHGNVAAARAFMSASNPNQALKHIELALKEHPHASEVLTVYLEVLEKLERFDLLEATATDWLARRPNEFVPSAMLLSFYGRRGDKKKARGLIEGFRAGNSNPHTTEKLEAAYKTWFGKAEEGYSWFAEEAARRNDKVREFKMNSLAASSKSKLREAILEAEFARKLGDDGADSCARLSMLCFRAFRFQKCREYAQLALKADPTLVVPKELLLLSWLVLFPPFLLAHASIELASRVSPMKMMLIALALLASGGWGIVAVVLLGVLNLISTVGIPPSVSVVLFIAFGLYMPFIGKVSKLLGLGRKAKVKLRDY
jgi:tetratricopeptide (TPR) repeat protein